MKIDGRTLDHKTSETIRIMAVRRVREGEAPGSVMKSGKRLIIQSSGNAPNAVAHFGIRSIPAVLMHGLPAHKARLVAAYVQSLEGRLELHFLPGYAPDLNPDEFVWNHLRHHGTTKTPLRKNESLRIRVEQNLAAIKSSPKLVRSFFVLHL
jgi:transposase